jgi:hypothetical protein
MLYLAIPKVLTGQLTNKTLIKQQMVDEFFYGESEIVASSTIQSQ